MNSFDYFRAGWRLARKTQQAITNDLEELHIKNGFEKTEKQRKAEEKNGDKEA